MAYRFARDLDAHEGDLPGSLGLKRRLLSKLEARPVELHALDAGAPDFRFPEGMLGASTLVVAEGLFMYLPKERVRAILRQVAAAGSSIVFTFMGLDASGRPSFGRGQGGVDGLLRRVGEPFTWGVRPSDVAGFVSECGLMVRKVLGVDEVPGMVAGEWICFAGIGDAETKD